MTSIWIVSEDPALPASLAAHLRVLGQIVFGEPERSRFGDDAGHPDLLVLGAVDEPSGDLARLERLLEFVRRVEPYRRAAPPVLYLEPAGGHPAAALATALIDDRPVAALPWPSDPEEIVAAAGRLLDRPELPASLSARARRDWIDERVARSYASLDLPALRHAIDPRNAARPVLLCGEHGTGRGLLARYIHTLAEPVRESLVLVPAAALVPGEIEPRLLARIAGRRISAYLSSLDRAASESQRELAHVLGESGLLGYEPVRWIASAERPRALVRALRELPWIRVDLPPLRERSDLAELVREWLRSWSERTGRRVEADAEAIEMLARYSWPGNLSELEAVLAASITRVRGDRLEAGDLLLGVEPVSEPLEPGTAVVEEGGAGGEAEPDPGIRYETGEPIDMTAEDIVAVDDPAGVSTPVETKSLVERSPEIDELVAPLAQEIREPLLAIRTYANLLEQRPDDESVRRELSQLVEGDLGRIEDSLHRLERFASFGDPEISDVDLGQLVSSEIERRRALMRERSLVILEELDRKGALAQADEEQLRFAVGGLFDRALRMVPPGGDLYVGSLHRPAQGDGRARERVLIRFHSPEDVLVTPEGVPGPPMPLEVVIAKTLVARMGGAFAVDASGAQDNVILLELPA